MAQQEVVIVGEDGTEHVFPPGFDPKRAADIVRRQSGGDAPPKRGDELPTATALVAAGRHAPGAARATTRAAGRVAVNHPSAVQKAIGAVARGAAGGAGAASGGIVGAIVGSAAGAGLTPKQETIRYVGGRLVGEAPDVAREAGRATGIHNYIKSTSGMTVKPSDILPRPRGLPAAEAYANQYGRDILKLYGPSGEVVAGPTATPAARPSAVSRGASKMAATAADILPILTWLQGAVGITDLAQTVDPHRQDIGVMGIGASPQTVPGGAELDALNAQNIARMEARQTNTAAQRAQLLDALLTRFGLR